jgi:hypothetical protein
MFKLIFRPETNKKIINPAPEPVVQGLWLKGKKTMPLLH